MRCSSALVMTLAPSIPLTGVLVQLGRAESSITELAERFEMTLTGMRKHVGVLENAGLVVTEKVGRVRYCRISARRLDAVVA